MFGAKAIIYEQNSIIGKANRLLAKISDLKLSMFELGDGWQQIPSPVRKEFVGMNNPTYNCDGKIKIIVIGGSQGAMSFSSIVPMALSMLNDEQK
jgi:UDP-N-acetylglucosamine--N-acetylmuramyl-(pentapeptide) pyrophosphoryl-undecaprenol N-acetylglucosamine transferase